MKLNFRDLKQQKFTIDAEPSDTILQVKEKVAAEKGWEVSSQKLIYSGKILVDTNTVESSKIEEKGFIVCMVSKPKAAAAAPKAAPAAAVPSTPQASSSTTPAPPAAPQQSSNAPAAAAAPPATPSPAQPAQSESMTSPGFGDPSAMMIGGRNAQALQEMESMGFPRAECERAMRAAYHNPDRAIEYLLNGIPPEAEERLNAPQQQQQQQQPAAHQQPTSPTPATAGTAPAATAGDEPSAGEVNLFDMAAQTAQGGGARGARSGAAAGGAGANPLAGAGGAGGAGTNMDFLRSNPQFQHLRQLVQQQPAMLEPILQQVADANPQLAHMISQNQEQFLQLLSEDLAGEGAQPPGTIQVTQEEANAIDRLVGLGFPRGRAIQAYFACDKNEELAANFLFEQPDDDDD